MIKKLIPKRPCDLIFYLAIFLNREVVPTEMISCHKIALEILYKPVYLDLRMGGEK